MKYRLIKLIIHHPEILLISTQRCLGLDVLALLPDERLVDVGDDSTPGDGRLDQSVQLLVTTDSELTIIKHFNLGTYNYNRSK